MSFNVEMCKVMPIQMGNSKFTYKMVYAEISNVYKYKDLSVVVSSDL